MSPTTRTDLPTRPLEAVDDAWATWPRGDRPAALRAAATEVRARLTAAAPVAAVRTLDLVVEPLPAGTVIPGVRRAPVRTVPVVHRLVVVRFTDLAGADRVLVWDPRVPDSPAADGATLPAALARPDTVTSALHLLGLTPEDVDVCGIGHLHGQDPRLLLGTEVPIGTDRAVRAPLLPRAEVLVARAETDTLRAPHPSQRPRYAGAMHGVRTDLLRETEGSLLLGEGVAVLQTPGHTAGHRSLALATREGVWVVSGNGHVADAWHPHLSRSPGLRERVEATGQEVLVGADAESALDQHDSMVLERAVADAHRTDPRWRTVLPVAELVPAPRAWSLRGAFLLGGVNAGVLRPA